jgi:hypothetical protein
MIRKNYKKEAELDLTSDYGRLYDEVGDPEDVAEEIGNKVVNVLKRIASNINDAVNESYSVDEFLTNLQFILDGIRGDYTKKYPLGRLHNLAGGTEHWRIDNSWTRDYTKKFIDVVFKGAGNLFDSFVIDEDKGSTYGYTQEDSWVWLIATENFSILRGHNKEDMDSYDLLDVAHLIEDRVKGKGWVFEESYRGVTIKSAGWNLGGISIHFMKDSPKLVISICAV